MQQIHSLPQPRQGGYRWEELEEARATYNRIRAKAREVEAERYALEAEIKTLIDRDVRRLGEAWLNAEDGEPAEDPEIARLQAKKRELERREWALERTAIPDAEAQVAQVIGRNRLIWQAELWGDLPERAAETRAALAEAAAIIQQAFHRTAMTLSLIDWTNSGNPLAYSPPSGADRVIGEAFARLHEFVGRVEARISEREAERGVELEEEEIA